LGLVASLAAFAALPGPVAVAQASPPTVADRLHGKAVESFRAGRFAEAYGRFVALAEAGHPASARYALWMCEHGPALFGSDWDCGPVTTGAHRKTNDRSIPAHRFSVSRDERALLRCSGRRGEGGGQATHSVASVFLRRH
jgi:hypothetical protein